MKCWFNYAKTKCPCCGKKFIEPDHSDLIITLKKHFKICEKYSELKTVNK